MSEIIHVGNESQEKNENFETEILNGLKTINKRIESKFLYDQRGCELFNKITRHPDYYLARSEMEILQKYKRQIARLIGKSDFNLVELGPGEGIKTAILIEEFLSAGLNFTYLPIDISVDYLQYLSMLFVSKLPQIKINPIHSDYFTGLTWLSTFSNFPSCVLFLGSSIGNFDYVKTQQFFCSLWKALQNGDFVLIGFDLRKDLKVLMRAYNDSDGLTREFNFNVLRRLNRELKCDFDLNKFYHYATYNVYSGAMESYLVSLEPQVVTMGRAADEIFFAAFEPIHLEYSYKYLLSQINEFAEHAGFTIVQNFSDANQYFVDSLWQVKK